MRLFRIKLRVRTLFVFGVGFLIGSRTGRGPWEAAVAKWNELQGKAAEFGDGHLKGRFEAGRDTMQDAVGGSRGEMPGDAAPEM